MKSSFSLLALVCLTLLVAPVYSQSFLSVGKTQSGSLKTGDQHDYQLELDGDDFVFGQAMQISVDVVVELLDPEGLVLESFDQPARGPEVFDFYSNEAGTYTLRVTPFEEEEGDYDITVSIIEPRAITGPGIADQMMAPYDNDFSPGATIAIIEKGEIKWVSSYGMADLNWKKELEPTMRTNLGSTSKQFTSFAVAMLEEQGKLSMDDDVRKYIPELKDFGTPVKVRHLVHHTSGYREILNTMVLTGWGFYDRIPEDASIKVVQNQEALQSEPGSEWNYCNTAYDLLAQVVAVAADQDFDEWMQENVFDPLGMENTTIKTTAGQVIPNTALSYGPGREGKYEFDVHNHGMPGGTNVYSNVYDLLKWVNNLMTAQLADKEMYKRLITPEILNNGDTTEYGYGLFIDQQKGQKRIHHGGADAGYRTMLTIYPDIDAAVLMLSNHGNMNTRMIWEIAESFFPEAFEQETDEEQADEATASDEFDLENFNYDLLDLYVGEYSMEEMPAFILGFRRDGDKLISQATGQPELEVFPIAENKFELRVVDAQVEFHVDDDGKVRTITLYQNGPHKATRVEEEAEAIDLASYTGRYFSSELEVFYNVEVKEDHLVITSRHFDDLDLNHATEDLFSGGFPISEVQFARSEAGEVEGFSVSNGRTRGINFSRSSE
jgi:CubicO group peptidase (beta-lactamase class C family)